MTTLTPADRALDRLLSPALEAWRPDVPDLWPFCTGCGTDIKTGDRYHITAQNKVLCRGCTASLVYRHGQQS